MVSGEKGSILEGSFFAFNSAQEKYILGKYITGFFSLAYMFLFKDDKYYILAQFIFFPKSGMSSVFVCAL